MSDNKKYVSENEDSTVEISIPFKAELVSIVRLTASGVANKIGFDIETIEDIKVAIAEVCNKFIKSGSSKSSKFSIRFHLKPEKLLITFHCEDNSFQRVFSEDTDGLGLSIITALMDEVEYNSDGEFLFSMSKTLEGNN